MSHLKASDSAIGMTRKPGPGGAAANKAGRPAFVWFDENVLCGPMCSLSFSEMHINAAALGCVIRGMAVAAGQHAPTSYTVGLVLSRTAALPMAQLAAYKAGATFVPCDPAWPASRIVDILIEAQATAILCDVQSHYQQLDDVWPGPIIRVTPRCEVADVALADVDFSAFNQQMDLVERQMGAQQLPWSPPHVMYIMYTSGSTGKPKGCVVPTAGVWHRFRWGNKVLGFTEDDVFIHKTPATFDCSIAELWVPMILGCTAAVVPDAQHLDFTCVRTVMERAHVTVAHFVPSVLALFLDFVSPGDLPSLRQISCTGEALLKSHRAKLTKSLGRPLPLFNLYGPTEASIEVTYYEAKDEEVEHGGAGFPIGYAGDDGVLMYVVDTSDPFVLVPDGEQGEICIGGVQVALGYLQRPELSGERFLPNPHAEGLMYRTGDLGFLDEHGCLHYQGRADRQVKVGGVRMELGEIEAVCLKLFPELLNVAVEKVDDALVGVYSLRPGNDPVRVSTIKGRLSEQLPSSYVPPEWFERDSLPLGSAGKVDHKALTKWIVDQRTAAMWGSIYDEMYFADGLQVDDGVDDPTMDWAAYTDSFTGKMHERETILEWVDETVKEIVAFKPRRVIEMGCGKGMILFRVASCTFVQQYVGADLARGAVGHVERVWRSHYADADVGPNGLDKLSTCVRDASNFGGYADGHFSSVVCNGVSMYFPSASYLVEVLTNGVAKLDASAGGCMHMGDVISLEAHPLLVLRTARHRSHSYGELLLQSVRDELMAAAKDRCYSHLLFYELVERRMLPNVAAVEVQLKHGKVMSEFTRYRYNVLLHVGTPQPPLPLVEVEGAAARDLGSLADTIAETAAAQSDAAVAAHGVLNARLSADELLYQRVIDAQAPAVQLGAGEGGGIDPAALRQQLEARLPHAHVVLTWARSGGRERMDAYVFPRAKLHAGLRAISSAVSSALLVPLGSGSFDVDGFTNQIATAERESAMQEVTETALHELKEQWAQGNAILKRQAVLKLLSAKLNVSHGAIVAECDSFTTFGGNSFLAMQCIGAMRSTFGISLSVFALTTETFGRFADIAVSSASEPCNALSSSPALVVRGDSSREGPACVFFPMAGGSPQQFAPLYLSLSAKQPHATCYFVQPAGRDARAHEAHAATVDEFVTPIVHALVAHLERLRGRACVFVGDSWGSIAALLVAQRLHGTHAFSPTHLVVSGNASPRLTSTHKGLGTYCEAPISTISDSELVDFLVASGVERDDAKHDVVRALRADCELYEAYVRDEKAPPLPCVGLALCGADDTVTRLEDMLGWLDELANMECTVGVVPSASHHIYAEQPEYIAARLSTLIGDEALTSPRIISRESSRVPSFTSVTDFVADKLGSPCEFIKGVDTHKLCEYRIANMRFRSGSAWGSRGELSSLYQSAR